MKKIYATILSVVLGSTALFAQEEEHSLCFMRNGEVIENGATITISEVEYEDLGGLGYMAEMSPKLSVRNDADYDQKTVMTCEGLSGDYTSVSFCYGVCASWGDNTIITCPTAQELKAGAVRDLSHDIHAASEDFLTEKNFSLTASVKLTLFPELDEDDCVTLTLVFDTNTANLKGMKGNKQMEVYNLCGKKIANTTSGLPKGIYIIKQNGSSRKVVIK